MENQVAHTLEVLSEWSEGFALAFVFSDTARCSGLPADALYCAQHASVSELVDDVLNRVADATRPVVLNFYGCPTDVIQEAVRRLNERRSMLEQLPKPLVIVCPAAARMLVQYGAPDLWHIRTLVPGTALENDS